MIFAGVIMLCIWLLLVPVFVGGVFTGVDKLGKNLLFRWISGQICLWAGFQLICVPLVLLEKDYTLVRQLFLVYTVGMVLISLFIFLKKRRNTSLYVLRSFEQGQKREMITWGIFAALLIFQLIQAVRMTYADGDDAYYVAISTITENANTMYRKLPYTGGATQLDARHGLAPFPIWIAFLSSMSGIPAVSTAHIAVSMMLIAMTYGIFYLLGAKLFPKRREYIPVFLIFTELLVLFGDYSFYTAENFMIARSRQGKAALGNIIIPVLFLLLLILLEKLKDQRKVAWSYWILLAAAMLSGCLCSTLGALLTCMLVGITGLCSAFVYRRFQVLLLMAVCCAPCGFFAALYLVLG